MKCLDELCCRLLSLSGDVLQHLDDEDSLDLPKVRGKSILEAVSSIRAHVESIDEPHERMECIAHIYCCLAGQGLIRPWVLYRGNTCMNAGVIVANILNEMDGAHKGAFYTKSMTSFTCTCLMASSRVGTSSYEPYFFCTWGLLSYLAVYQAPEGHSLLLRRALSRVLGGEPNSSHLGIYGNMHDAMAAASQLFS
ncbi:hypothetical protein HPB50_015178 [Hyalomma asiaticum]|uniref:Uncharacterized protein n=1 Tax=Hyalomma asiaticum TaxID=266040 RepID=A0ACB7RR33_HYAAI|nr:hypothetical protein HPB50_029207 [Hyalomma asiaticum]KAH6924314.1 hypothetical protein HPB50_015178 [Hyalomma asiaticum]